MSGLLLRGRWVEPTGRKESPSPALCVATHRHGDTHHPCEQVYSQGRLLGMEALPVPKASIILSTSLAVGGNLRTDLLNLNIQNGSLLNLGHFEVEMYLALGTIFCIGSQNLHSCQLRHAMFSISPASLLQRLYS